MKHSIALLGAFACTMLTTGLILAADKPAPGQADFGSFTAPSGGGEFVEVNVPGGLISLAARFIEKQEPDVAKLLNGIKQVRVNVIGVDDTNREDLSKRAQKVRTDLSAKGWEKIVTAQKQGQDVSVYLKMDQGGGIQGVTVVVIDGSKQAVFANVVGDIRPEQLAMLGEKLNIEPLKKIGEAAKEQK
jgi:predicted RNA-binding protein with RPS1 domain